MKTKIFSLILLLGAVFTSCDSWEPNTGNLKGTGQLLLSDINIANGENVIARSDENFDNFIVTVYDAQGAVKGQWKYAEMPEIVELPVANDYTVNVKSHEQADQAWSLPYYEGDSEKFNIEDQKVTRIGTITCSFANIAVTIRYTERMKAMMAADCKTTVVANQNGRLEFTANETRTGYFKAVKESPTLVAVFEGTVDGKSVSLTKNYDGVVAGNHYYITYDVKPDDPILPDETGDIYIDPATGIVIDLSVDGVDVPGNVDIDDEILNGNDRPGKEDPKDPTPDQPEDPEVKYFTFTGTFPLDEPNQVVDEEDLPDDQKTQYVVTIESVNGLADLQVEIISQSLNEDMLSSVDLSTKFSLANPGSLKGALSGSFGFPIEDQIVGQTKVVFDITPFVPLLAIYPDETHQFKLTVTDSEGNSEIKVLTFNT